MTTLDKYLALYDKMVDSRNPDFMRVFGDAEIEAFEFVAEKHPDYAEKWLNRLQAIEYANYLSEEEAQQIVGKLVHQSGAKGAKWGAEMIDKVRAMGGEPDKPGAYNIWALWAVVNMIYSDHARSIANDMGRKSVEEVTPDAMLYSCYLKAVEKLEDVDNRHFVRRYFDV